MGRKREDRSLLEWEKFGDKFVSLIKDKKIKVLISNTLSNINGAEHDEQNKILKELNTYKEHEQTKDVWCKWVKQINTAKDDANKIKMDCSTEAADLVNKIKKEYGFKNTIEAMDYIIKTLPTNLRHQLHEFAKTNTYLLRDKYSDLINSWELESIKEFNWVEEYSQSTSVPIDPSYDELLLTIIIDFSNRYVQLEDENNDLKLKLAEAENFKIESLKKSKDKQAGIYDTLEMAWKDVLQNELLEECLVNRDRVGSPNLLQSNDTMEDRFVIIKYKTPYDKKLSLIENSYKNLNMAMPKSLKNYRKING
jgi:hypothetical protein